MSFKFYQLILIKWVASAKFSNYLKKNYLISKRSNSVVLKLYLNDFAKIIITWKASSGWTTLWQDEKQSSSDEAIMTLQSLSYFARRLGSEQGSGSATAASHLDGVLNWKTRNWKRVKKLTHPGGQFDNCFRIRLYWQLNCLHFVSDRRFYLCWNCRINL